jgi:transcriptional regulator with XRE-family HTH domain
MIPVHPQLEIWMKLSEALATAAATGAERTYQALHRRRGIAGHTRKPGLDTPMWNVCASLLRNDLRHHGAKAALARYLGIPRQRLSDFLAGRRRLPDAEIMLRMLHWLAERRAGHDPSV